MYLIVVIKTNFILIYHKVRNIYNKIQVLTWGRNVKCQDVRENVSISLSSVPQLSCPKVQEGDSSKSTVVPGEEEHRRDLLPRGPAGQQETLGGQKVLLPKPSSAPDQGKREPSRSFLSHLCAALAMSTKLTVMPFCPSGRMSPFPILY